MASEEPAAGGGDATLLEVILETAPDAIVTIDTAGRILSFSPSAERMFGYPAEEVTGRNVSCLMPHPHRQQHDGYISRYLETGARRIIGIGRRMMARRRDGSVFEVELAVGEHATPGRRVFTGFLRDISESMATQREMNHLRRMLDQLTRSRMLGEVATALAHEVNQPLTAIGNFATAASRALEGGAHDPEAVCGHLARIGDEARRAGEIIRRMRRLVDDGEVDLQPVNINDLVEETLRLSRYTLLHQEVHVDLDLGEDLPPVLADRIQIQQVVLNLVHNALEAISGDAGGHVEVSTGPGVPRLGLRARRVGGGEIMVTVSDTGPGIDPDLRETLFEPLISGRPQGVGVGLAICRTIVLAHGGRIWAEDRDGGGTDIHFTLRAAEAP